MYANIENRIFSSISQVVLGFLLQLAVVECYPAESAVAMHFPLSPLRCLLCSYCPHALLWSFVLLPVQAYCKASGFTLKFMWKFREREEKIGLLLQLWVSCSFGTDFWYLICKN